MKLHLGTLKLESPDFLHGQPLPVACSADGEGRALRLSWSDPQESVRSFALISHDPDAPLTNGFDHWVVYNIPGTVRELNGDSATGYTVGLNGLGEPTWCPASPPPGHGTHFYYFHLYALDAELNLPAGLTAAELMTRIDEHIIEQARVVGTYER
jgi:Raf kinase inhibitor-like YbhB/YbcL family protein